MRDVNVGASPSASLSCFSGFLPLESDVGAITIPIVLFWGFLTPNEGKVYAHSGRGCVRPGSTHTLETLLDDMIKESESLHHHQEDSAASERGELVAVS